LILIVKKENVMQLLLHLPESLAERFKQAVPARQRSAFVAGLLEKAFPEEDDPLYRIALEVERDAVLNAEMREWRDALAGDGIRGTEDDGGKPDAAR
jgi:hypothetical protein